MEIGACAVGRIGPDGPWVGFAPSLDDGYDLVVGPADAASRRRRADADDLLSLALAYFAEELDAPPEELAATHGDVGALVRHVEHEQAPERSRLLAEAVDAIDDGLEAEVTIARLTRALADGEEAAERIRRRAQELLGR
jgi:hypothetical protein